MKNIVLMLVLLMGCSHSTKKSSSHDPLPSWRETQVKKSIIEYVSKITEEGSSFVPMKDRIATFDNDGTLWSEMPLTQGIFSELEAKKLGIPIPAKKKMTEKELLTLFTKANTGMTDEAYEKEVKEFFTKVNHPQLNVPFLKTRYRPQLELIRYLTKNGFKVYICSGGTTDFMRVISEEFYGVPEEQVIGSTFQKQYKSEDNTIQSLPKADFMNDKEGKVYAIDRVIGKRPIFTSGNVRSGGDVYMLRYSQGSKYPNFQLLINHDDEVREFSYKEEDGKSLKWANKYGWHVVSMKKDWEVIFTN